MTMTVTTAELDMLLDLGGAIDADRATFLLGQATALAESVLTPLPDSASAVVYSVAARAYTNPTGVAAQTVGPESVQYGSAVGGLYLSKADVATLRRLNGSGGAFTVDPLSPFAGRGQPIWDLNVYTPGGVDPFDGPYPAEDL